MASRIVEGMEYAPFGEGWVKRVAPDGEWEPVALDDVPAGVFAPPTLPSREPFAKIIRKGDPEYREPPAKD